MLIMKDEKCSSYATDNVVDIMKAVRKTKCYCLEFIVQDLYRASSW